MYPIRRRQRRMRGNLPGPEGLARRGASAALHGLPVVTTTGGAARLASAPSPCQRGSRRIHTQAPMYRQSIQFPAKDLGLREDVHALGTLIGETLRDQGGEELFNLVEGDRLAAISRRDGGGDANGSGDELKQR